MRSLSTGFMGNSLLARDPNRRTWASGMAAAIPAAIALIRGSIGMAAVVEGTAVMGDSASPNVPGLRWPDRCRDDALLMICRTLPLSGRQGAWGGGAEAWWRPVHSRGLFDPRLAFTGTTYLYISKYVIFAHCVPYGVCLESWLDLIVQMNSYGKQPGRLAMASL